MPPLNEHLERLIVRYLDGELSPGEVLELQREVLRNPQARRTLDEYERADALAAEALGQVFGGEAARPRVEVRPSAPSPHRAIAASPIRSRARRDHRGWWLVPGAIAAALLAMVVPFPGSFRGDEAAREKLAGGAPLVVHPAGPGAVPRHGLEGASGRAAVPVRTVADGGASSRRISRDTGREVIGVIGDDGNLYWIEVDRTWTIKQPPRQTADSRGDGAL
ncbi:MAG: hypothetical protein HY763_10335 [Planctomycetes bacterium]|nr:hypothetical protein [Planctomycetota bacterium]